MDLLTVLAHELGHAVHALALAHESGDWLFRIGGSNVDPTKWEKCKGCGLCVASCRSGALHLKGFDNNQRTHEMGSGSISYSSARSRTTLAIAGTFESYFCVQREI